MKTKALDTWKKKKKKEETVRNEENARAVRDRLDSINTFERRKDQSGVF